jgi:hypothetical protein
VGLILGLDVSTRCVGVCLLRNDIEPVVTGDYVGMHIELLDRIEFKKCKTIWEKADVVAKYLYGLHRWCQRVERVCVEEALMGFKPGMSSAATISTLMRFNGIVSYIAREEFGVDPEYIGSSHARKVCGIKLQRTVVAGKSGKEQVFDHMATNDLKHVAWPKTKTGKDVAWSRDATDAYVIARAAYLNVPVEAKKSKKPKKVVDPEVQCTYPGCDKKRIGGKRRLTMCKEHQPFPA